ncbi:hypothetical protein [Chondrinema litorale]|uniref:hypothetical protein n=1 Tax=Chondrinema litorale TaxID=2994555 RepID=UPI0025436C18|nr:hypothetical protein [Chondrinema litorale]UZR96722.1 hypothetical protein OQ292_21500 [Chondrinema litorale]
MDVFLKDYDGIAILNNSNEVIYGNGYLDKMHDNKEQQIEINMLITKYKDGFIWEKGDRKISIQEKEANFTIFESNIDNQVYYVILLKKHINEYIAC